MDTRTKNTECSYCRHGSRIESADKGENGRKTYNPDKVTCHKPDPRILKYIDDNKGEFEGKDFYYPIHFNPFHKPFTCNNYSYKEGK